MQVFLAICIKHARLEGTRADGAPDALTLERGREYLVSAAEPDGSRVVFAHYWARLTAEEFPQLFAGLEPLNAEIDARQKRPHWRVID